jgi:hypothetical protein
MSNGLWIILWAIFLSAVVCIFLWAASRKPVEQAQDPFNNACEQAHRQMPLRQEPSPRSYLADIYPVLGEYPKLKPLTVIQKEHIAGSTAAPKVAHISEVADWPTSDMESLQVSDVPLDSIMVTASVSNSKPFFAEKFKKDARHPSVKSKTPVAKKAPAKKAAKPVAKKRATKRATNKA